MSGSPNNRNEILSLNRNEILSLNRNEILSVLSFSKYAHDIEAWNRLTDDQKVFCFAMWRKYKAHPYPKGPVGSLPYFAMVSYMMWVKFSIAESREEHLSPYLSSAIALTPLLAGVFFLKLMDEGYELSSIKTYRGENRLAYLLENPIRVEACCTPDHKMNAKNLPQEYFEASMMSASYYEMLAKDTKSRDFIANSTFSKMNELFKQSFVLPKDCETFHGLLEQMSSEDIYIPQNSILSTMLHFAHDTDEHLADTLAYFSTVNTAVLPILKEQFTLEMNCFKQCFRHSMKVDAYNYLGFAILFHTLVSCIELSPDLILLAHCMTLLLTCNFFFVSRANATFKSHSRSPMARLSRVISTLDPLDEPTNSLSATLFNYSGKFDDIKDKFMLAIFDRPTIVPPVQRVDINVPVLMFRGTEAQGERRGMVLRPTSSIAT